MKSIVLLLSGLLIGFLSFSQSLERQVSASSGGSGQSSSAMLEWTLGETAVQTFTSSGHILTQGFHQGLLLFTNIFNNPSSAFYLYIYPNPTTDKVYTQISGNDTPLYYRLTDLKGRNILELQILPEVEAIDFSTYPSGVYLLTIQDKNQQIQKIFKVVKNH